MTNEKALCVNRVTVGYGKSVVLEGASFSVGRGEIVGLSGANGAGKTTTLRACFGMVKCKGGEIEVFGRPLPRSPSKMAGLGVAHVPEGRQCLGSLTVLENLRVAAYGARRALDPTTLSGVIDLFPALEPLMGRRTAVLSGGEQQMVALARGLISKSALLMIDELSLGLAPVVVSELWKVLLRVRAERAVSLLVVDQNVRQLRQMCDRVYVLERGQMSDATGWDGAELGGLYGFSN